MDIKHVLKTNSHTKKLYLFYKDKKDARMLKERISYHGSFIDRSKRREKLCIVLAGYKEMLYPAVFGRIISYLPADVDVCVITSGLWSDKINKLCQKQNWSYLSTKENNVSLVQNVAIHLHPNAKYIYKLDEDMFITEGFFENLFKAYEHTKQSEYCVGFVAPLIPINGYGHMRLLEKTGLKNVYEERFEKPIYMAGPHRMVENSGEVAKFFWRDGGIFPDIDDLNRTFSSEPLEERPCPIRFSIGAILFERSLWEEMGYFKVPRSGSSLGADEVQLCSYCIEKSRAMMISENVVVGHFSFGGQFKAMKQYFEKHPEVFEYKFRSSDE